MVEPKYPFRDSLRRAQDIYLEAVSDFIEIRLGGSSNDVLDFSDISDLFRKNWYDSIDGHFRSVDEYYEARSVVQLIVEGRNRCSHPPWDLNPDYVRTHLFIIAEFLGKINRNLDQLEVNTIIDKLFYDDTPERLDKVEQQLKNTEAEKEESEKEKKELEKKLEILHSNASELESQKNKLESDIRRMSQEMIEKNQKLKATDTQLKKSKERVKKSIEDRKEAEGRIRSLEEQIEGMETDYNLEKTTLKKQLTAMTEVIHEKNVLTDSLSELLSIITLNQPDDSIFPQVNISSSVRIIDQRNTNRKNYIFNLLKLKQPSIYYVQDEDRMYHYITENIPEISDAIEIHNKKTPKENEKKLLEKLEQGELNTIVSNSIFSGLPKNDKHIHIVFCNLSPGIEAFIDRCQPAFLSDNYCFIHLIYDYELDLDSINSRFPDRDAFNTIYKKLKCVDGIESNFISTDNILNELDIEEVTFDPICNIFQEIGMIEKKMSGVKLLSDPKKKLEESTVFNEGLKEREKYQEFYDFQKSYSCAELWDRIGEKAEISNFLKDYNNTLEVSNSGLEEELERMELESADSPLE